MLKDIFAKYGAPSLDTIKLGISDTFVPMESGIQKVIVSAMTIDENKSQTGIVTTIKLTIVDGRYEGRSVRSFLNIVHKNATAQEFGLREFAKFAAACGYSPETAGFEPEMYIGKKLNVLIGKEEPNANGQVFNKVVDYMPLADGESSSEDGAAGSESIPF